MAERKGKGERVFNSFEEFTREMFPSEASSDMEARLDAAELGRILAAESLSVIERALGSSRARLKREDAESEVRGS